MLEREATDKRAQRTRQALLRAFFHLVMERRRYDDIRMGDILALSGVGRSTFYEHFASKDALLASSLAGPFSILADAMRARDNTAHLIQLLEHFWGNRALARGTFVGAVRRKTTPVLVELIEERLKIDGAGKPSSLIVPVRLAAIQLAEGMLTPIAAWLLGDVQCSAETLALALRRTSRATLLALGGPA